MNPFMNINNVLSDRQFSHQQLPDCLFHGSDIEMCDLQCRDDRDIEAFDLL